MTAVLGCIADDFTGGTDLAETLSRNGMRTIQLLGVPDTALASEAAAQADALVVALKIRTVPVDEAVSQALAALEALRARGEGGVQAICHHIARQRANALAPHGVALVRHGR